MNDGGTFFDPPPPQGVEGDRVLRVMAAQVGALVASFCTDGLTEVHRGGVEWPRPVLDPDSYAAAIYIAAARCVHERVEVAEYGETLTCLQCRRTMTHSQMWNERQDRMSHEEGF